MQIVAGRQDFLIRATERWVLTLSIILGLAFLLRLAWAMLVMMEPVSDGNAYNVFATNLAQHGVYGWTPEQPGAYWPVGTSAIIALIYVVWGTDFSAVVVLNLAVSVAVVWQVFALARRYFGVMSGLIAAAIVALWPSLIMYVTVMASEVFFIFLVLGGLLAFEYRGQRGMTALLLAGALWAGASYVRPLALLLPLVFGMAALLRGMRASGQVALAVAVVYAVMAAAIAPWTMRNQAALGEPVLISTNFGPVFWMGNNPQTTGGYQDLPGWAEGLSETERALRLKDEAYAYVAEEPLQFVKRTVVKFLRLHERETIAVVWNEAQIREVFGDRAVPLLKVLASGFWYAVLMAALAGLFRLMRSSGLWQVLLHPCFLGWMYFAWVHAVIILGDRYHFPSIPFIAALAAYGLQPLARRKNGAANVRVPA